MLVLMCEEGIFYKTFLPAGFGLFGLSLYVPWSNMRL